MVSVRNFSSFWAGSVLFASTVFTSSSVDAITVEISAPSSRNVVQGQVFYSQTVSRVSNGKKEACMVSTGSNWRDTGVARRALDVQPLLEQGGTFEAALAGTEPVSLKQLNSNTPFVAFVVDRAGDTFVRFGAGFKIANNSAAVALNQTPFDLRDIEHEVEKRGDTLKISDKATAAAMLKAFFDGGLHSFSAQSHKPVSNGTEHVLRYEFVGKNDREALSKCRADLSNPKKALRVGSYARFALKPVENSVIQDRMMARAMACNRDLDPDGAEVMEFDGPLLGFTTPLSYALVQRDSLGRISNIWSGDLWRVSRTGSGLKIAFSNSVTRQGPLDAQIEKACTRFGDAFPVFMDNENGGVLGVAADFDDVLTQAGLASAGFAASTGSGGGASTSFGGSGGGGSPGTKSTPKPPVSLIVKPPSSPPKTNSEPEGNANVVPVPASAGLLLGALAVFAFAGIRGRKRPH